MRPNPDVAAVAATERTVQRCVVFNPSTLTERNRPTLDLGSPSERGPGGQRGGEPQPVAPAGRFMAQTAPKRPNKSFQVFAHEQTASSLCHRWLSWSVR